MELLEGVPQTRLPNEIEVFWIVIKAAVATAAFAGINRQTHTEEKP